MRIPFLKSREEKQLERKIKYRRLQRGITVYLERLRAIRKTFRAHAKRALELEDQAQFRRYAHACKSVDSRLGRLERQALIIEGIQSVADMVAIDRDFAAFARDMGRALTDTLSPAEVARMETELEKGLLRAEEVDDLLGTVLDSVGDSVLTFGAQMSEDDLQSIAGELAAEDEPEMDPVKEAALEARLVNELATVKGAVGQG